MSARPPVAVAASARDDRVAFRVLVAQVAAIALALCAGATARATPSTAVLDSIVSPGGRYVGFAVPPIASDHSLGSLFHDLWPADDRRWRVLRWSAAQARYVEYAGSADSLRAGEGYWLVTSQPSHLRYYADPAATAGAIEVPLERAPLARPGWNQLGNPMGYTLAASDLNVLKRDTVAAFAAAGNRFTDHVVWTWNPDSLRYDAGTSIPPHAAFWLRITDADTSSAWRISDIGYTGYGAFWTDIVTDFLSVPTLAWSDSAGIVWAAAPNRYVDGGWLWMRMSKPGENAYAPSLTLAPDTTPYIAYSISPWGPARFGAVFSLYGGTPADTVGPGAERAAVASAGIDASGQVRVAIDDRLTTSLKYAVRALNNSWIVSQVNGSGAWGLYPSMAIDAAGLAHIAFVENGGALRYAVQSGMGWDLSTLAGFAGSYFKLGSRADGSTVVGFSAPGYPLDTAKVARIPASGAPVVEPIVLARSIGRVVLARGLDGRERAAVGDFDVNGHIRYGVRTSSGWEMEIVDSLPRPDGRSLSFTLDRHGNPHLLWQDFSSKMIRYAVRYDPTVRLVMGASAYTLSASRPAAVAAAAAPVPDWSLRLIAREAGHASTPVTLGVAGAGVVASGALQLGRPPLPQGDCVDLHVRARDDEAAVQDVTTDAATLTWDLELSGVAPGEIALQAESFGLPAGRRVWLRDPDAGWVRPLAPGAVTTLAATNTPRHLQLTVGSDPAAEAALPAPVGLLAVAPNPSRDVAGLRVDLDAPGVIHARIYDIGGRRVRELGEQRLAAGEHVLIWDGRDDGGRAAAPGVYVARVDAAGHTRALRFARVR